jgi:glycosyltransferase involved in cell wall biosynthesis
MRAAIYIADLTRKNVHLMPWRTIMEVAGAWLREGHSPLVISGGVPEGVEQIQGVDILSVERPKTALALARFVQLLRERGIQTLYFPVAPGPAGWLAELRSRLDGVRLVWFYPGAWYAVSHVAYACRFMGLRRTAPYWAQAVWPKALWVRQLLGSGAPPLIAMTEWSARQIQASGYPRRLITVVPPGREDSAAAAPEARADLASKIEADLSGEPYFLFFGPANPIRGGLQIVNAFRRFAAASSRGRLVCLFRDDGNVDVEPVRNALASCGCGSRIIAVWKSVAPSELSRIVASCHAVLKPFLLVPSEIPLAVIEATQFGKPVIGFDGDGTGAFIAQAGVSVRHGDVEALALAMARLVSDGEFYSERCAAAALAYQAHPTWAQVAQMWWAAGETQ